MRRTAPMLAVLAALAAGCTSSPAAQLPESADRVVAGPVEATESYVALGDSFTAGPLVPTTDLAEGCLRSDRNYPSLLAKRFDLVLTDVSCSGADTSDLVERQRTVRDATVPPQLRALEPETDLVTVGIGGNDLNLFSTLVRTCLGLRSEDPQGAPCADSEVGSRLLGSLDTVGANVGEALRRVTDRAPEARVVLVGYLRISPPDGSCPRELPFADGDVAFGDRLIRALGSELERAAQRAGVEYLDMYAASEGHDVCSDEPWVNGQENEPGLAAAFHPTPAGMRAVHRELARLLTA